MRKLFTLDEKNYSNKMPVIEKHTVRAIIKKDMLIAMQRGKNGVYKIPGGGVENSETLQNALIREVMEETGLSVIISTIVEIGEVEEIREDFFNKGQKYISHSYYYYCDVENESVPPSMTDNEKEKGYIPTWVSPIDAYNNNIILLSEAWMLRDTKFIKMLLDGAI